MKKTIFILVLSLLMGSASFAQVKIGVTAGVNAANFVVSDKEEDDYNRNRYGLIGGLVVDLGITKNFSIIPEIHYIQKGAGSSESDHGYTSKSMFNIDYIQMPLDLTLKFGKNFKFLIFAGPYVGYAISAKVKGEYTYDGETKKYDEKITLGKKEGELNPLDFGVDLGLGFQYGRGFLKLRCLAGLSNLQNNSSLKFSNAGIALTAGVLF